MTTSPADALNRAGRSLSLAGAVFAGAPHTTICLHWMLAGSGSRKTVRSAKYSLQEPRAEFRLWSRNHKHDDDARFRPAIGVFQKYELKPLVFCVGHLEIVGRIEVDKRNCFGWAAERRRDGDPRRTEDSVNEIQHRRAATTSDLYLHAWSCGQE